MSRLRSAVTVSLVPQAKGGPFVFWSGVADACAQASALGFDALEIFPPGAQAVKYDDIQPLVERAGLRVAAIGTGGGWVAHKLTLTHPDEAVRQKARRFVRELIDAAAKFSAPAIIGSMQGRSDDVVSREQALAWLSDAMEELGEHAGSRGVTLLFEPLNRYETNLFNRVGDTARWLRTLRTPHVRVLADLFHMAIEEADLAAALRDAGDRVGHVHFADSNRRAVGFGHTDVAPVIAALRAIGFTGYLSAEILPLPDPLAAARQTCEALLKHAAAP